MATAPQPALRQRRSEGGDFGPRSGWCRGKRAAVVTLLLSMVRSPKHLKMSHNISHEHLRTSHMNISHEHLT
eukprot:SAG31_NODE_1585_length_7821_cov_5.615903_1_plen_72_part_00